MQTSNLGLSKCRPSTGAICRHALFINRCPLLIGVHIGRFHCGRTDRHVTGGRATDESHPGCQRDAGQAGLIDRNTANTTCTELHQVTHCTQHTVLNTLYSHTVLNTLYSTHCTQHTVLNTLYSTHCTQHTVLNTLYSTHCTQRQVNRSLTLG